MRTVRSALRLTFACAATRVTAFVLATALIRLVRVIYCWPGSSLKIRADSSTETVEMIRPVAPVEPKFHAVATPDTFPQLELAVIVRRLTFASVRPPVASSQLAP